MVPVGGFADGSSSLRVSHLSVWSYSTKVREDEEEEGDKSWQDPGPLLGSASCLFLTSVGLWSQTAWLLL